MSNIFSVRGMMLIGNMSFITAPRMPFVWHKLLFYFFCNLSYLYKYSGRAEIQESEYNSNSTQRPSGYWTQQEGANCRLFFLQFAENNNINYKNPDHWYIVTKESIVSAGVCTTLFFKLYLVYLVLHLQSTNYKLYVGRLAFESFWRIT